MGMEVDVMPGAQDPTTCLWPQQPLHHCFFPRAFRYPSIHTVPNPYEFTVDGIRFLLPFFEMFTIA